MNAGKAIRDYLLTQATLTALISTRIYWPESPIVSTATPLAETLHVRVNELDGGHMHNLDAAFPTVQVSVFGKGKTDADALAAIFAVRDVILDFLRNGRLVVDGIFIVSTLQNDAGPFHQDGWWHAPMRFDLKYQEA